MRAMTAVVICLMGIMSGVAVASHSGPGLDRGGRDFAVGGGTNQFAILIGSAHFAFSATTDPLGTNPSGHVTARGDPDGPGPVEPFMVEGEVTCVRVSGNRASLKWRFSRAHGSAEPLEGGGGEAFVEDNGTPRAGQPIDRAGLSPPEPASLFELRARDCGDPNAHPGYDRIEKGNITVHDAVSP